MGFFTDRDVWFDTQVNYRATRVAVKRYGESEKFLGSCIVPSQMYPLNRNQYEVFHFRNAEQITDSKVLDIVDQQRYCIGRCYTNTENMVKALTDAGFNAESYCGWLFVSGSETPVHHCWTVLTSGDTKHVIDLCDDFAVMYAGENGNRIQEVEDPITRREIMADFELEAQKHPHHVRCFPLGCPTPGLLYIGCECDPMEGIRIWNNLIAKFPNHECSRNLVNSAMSLTQSIYAKHGLMDWTKEYNK